MLQFIFLFLRIISHPPLTPTLAKARWGVRGKAIGFILYYFFLTFLKNFIKSLKILLKGAPTLR